jgi:hypothetical protein
VNVVQREKERENKKHEYQVSSYNIKVRFGFIYNSEWHGYHVIQLVSTWECIYIFFTNTSHSNDSRIEEHFLFSKQVKCKLLSHLSLIFTLLWEREIETAREQQRKLREFFFWFCTLICFFLKVSHVENKAYNGRVNNAMMAAVYLTMCTATPYYEENMESVWVSE